MADGKCHVYREVLRQQKTCRRRPLFREALHRNTHFQRLPCMPLMHNELFALRVLHPLGQQDNPAFH